MQAMILAAGLGTRLWPLTLDRAKPAVPFLGQPLIKQLVEHVRRAGAERIVVNTHHQPESVVQALDGSDEDGRPHIAFSHEAQILGTGGAIGWALAQGHLQPDEPLVVVNGKLFTDIDVALALSTHLRTRAAVTMVLKPNVTRAHFREVLVDGTRIVGFGEGRIPSGAEPLLFTGIHVLSPEVLASIPAAFSDTVADIYPPWIEQGRVHAHVVDDRWWEFSTLERYLNLHHQAAMEGLCEDVVRSANAFVAAGASAARSVVWEGARVEDGATIQNAVIGADVAILGGERVENAVVVRASLAAAAGLERGDQGFVWGDRFVVPVARPV